AARPGRAAPHAHDAARPGTGDARLQALASLELALRYENGLLQPGEWAVLRARFPVDLCVLVVVNALCSTRTAPVLSVAWAVDVLERQQPFRKIERDFDHAEILAFSGRPRGRQ